MPTYEVTLISNATVRRTYHVSAKSGDEAIAAAKTGLLRCVDEEVLDDADTDAQAVVVGAKSKKEGRYDGR